MAGSGRFMFTGRSKIFVKVTEARVLGSGLFCYRLVIMNLPAITERVQIRRSKWFQDSINSINAKGPGYALT